MYIPESFRIDDPAVLADFMRRHSFATLITHDGGVPFASHIPLLIRVEDGRPGKLIGHVAKANPQWQHFAAGGEVLAVFQGPHAYVSPANYVVELAVPTWNYTAVHVYGLPRLMTDQQQVATVLRELVATYEAPRPQPWINELPAVFLANLQQAIVAFEIQITRVEGKFKLSQNRSAADRAGVIRALGQSANADSQAVAALMQARETQP